MLIFLVSTLLGCEAECQSDTRMNGDYAVWSYVTAATEDIEGTNTSDYPYPAMFFNGWSEWLLEYVPSNSTVKLDINGQPFTSEDFFRAPEDCLNWSMSFGGTYVSEWGSRHSFTWVGDLEYEGPHVGGTWRYEDSWVWEEEGLSGSVTIPEGQLSMNAGGEIGEE